MVIYTVFGPVLISDFPCFDCRSASVGEKSERDVY